MNIYNTMTLAYDMNQLIQVKEDKHEMGMYAPCTG